MHSPKRSCQIYGLANGSILIRSKSGAVFSGKARLLGFCKEVKAQKGEESLWPGELFKHSFKKGSKAGVYLKANGDVIIKSLVGKRLWKTFNY